MTAAYTPSQTIGPFFAILLPLGNSNLVADGATGAITVYGQLFDAEGAPVGDALIELWQANAEGRYNHLADTRELLLDASFSGFGRCQTAANGSFSFLTVKPGKVPGAGESWQAPHLNLTIFARGLLNQLHTRMYFPDEPAANAADPLLASITDSDVRATVMAHQSGPAAFQFDIRLGGERETAFLAIE